MNTKKYLIVLILKILENKSDKKNPITQIKIANEISGVYPCDRKTVGRNIGYLVKVGYPIVKTTKGFYLDGKKFTVDEMDFITKAVLAASDKTDAEKANIVNRLSEMFKNIYR